MHLASAHCTWIRGAAVAAILMASAGAARADEAPPPANYAVVLVGTTASHRPSGGPMSGWGRDISPSVGFGRFVRETIALEIDLGPTFVSGEYVSFSLVPGVVWAFSPKFYAAGRLVVPVDPEVNLGLYPGVGFLHAFGDVVAMVAELSVFSYVGRGDPDLGVAVTAGALYGF